MAVVTSVVMSLLRCLLCGVGRPRRRAETPPRQKRRKPLLVVVVGGCRWFTKLCPYHPKVIEAHRGSHPPDQQVDNYL